MKNKDKKEKERIKKTKFSDIDLFEEGHEEEPDELDLIDGLIKDPATTQDKEHNAYLRLMHEYKAEYAKMYQDRDTAHYHQCSCISRPDVQP